MGKLQFRFRKKQFYKPGFSSLSAGSYYYGPDPLNPLVAKAIQGVDPDPRTQWVEFAAQDVMSDGLVIEYELNEVEGEADTRGSNYKIGASEQLLITGPAALYFRDLLEDDQFSSVNVIEVEVYDSSCEQYYPIMIVDNKAYEWCNNQGCQALISLKESEQGWDCFAQASVFNNHQNWFKSIPPNPPTTAQLQAGDPPYHPRIGYCNEVRPTIWVIILFIILSPLIVIINFLNNLGANIQSGLLESLINCDRVHHAPKIRHLLKNACALCELDYDDDIFDTLDVHPLQQDEIPSLYPNILNPYYETCLYAPIYREGVDTDGNVSTFFMHRNVPVLTGFDLLEDVLKKPFNLKWKIKDNKLTIRNKHFYEPNIVFDFTYNDSRILNNVCFRWDNEKEYSFIEGVYSDNDSKDNLSNEVAPWYNHVIENNQANSPQMKGKLNVKESNIAGTAFIFDNRINQYIMRVLISSTLPAATVAQIIDTTKGFVAHKDDTVEKYRLIIYGGYEDTVKRRAKAQAYSSYEWINGTQLNPVFVENNDLYNPTVDTEDWATTSSSLPFHSFPHILYNYPMMFDPRFKFNLAAFYKLDQAKYSLRQKRVFTIEMALCCDVLNALKVWRISDQEVTTLFNQGGAYYNDIQLDEIVRYDIGLTPQLQAYTGLDLANNFRIIKIKVDYSQSLVELTVKSI